MSEWQPIDTASKGIVARLNGAEYGQYILAWPVFGSVARVRWWQAADETSRKLGYRNFLADGGNACHPTHWMPLPDPPSPGRSSSDAGG